MLTVNINISDSPQVEVDSSKLKVSTVEGGSVDLSCHVDANPPASVSWRHLNSGQVVSYSAQLALPSISRTKSGRYVCEASNDLGHTQSEEAVIDVKCK